MTAVADTRLVGKNLLIEVPDYDTDAANGLQVTYVRLGQMQPEEMPPAASSAAASDTASDDEDHSGAGAGTTGARPPRTPTRGGDFLPALTSVGPGDWENPRLFEDDWRTRNDTGVSNRARTAKLLASSPAPPVGWRDHTEGDRITTTRGDKLEIIGGNYKLVVQGHQDADGSSGIDFSGGQMQDFDAAPGTVNEIRWQDGRWKIYESTLEANVHTTFNGRSTSHYFGEEHRTVIGGAQHEYGGRPDHMKVTTLPATTVEDQMRVASFEEDIEVDGTLTSNVTAGILDSTVIASKNLREVVAATTHLKLELSALVLETLTGARFTTYLGGLAEVFVGGKIDIATHSKEIFGDAVQLSTASLKAQLTAREATVQAKITELQSSVTTLRNTVTGIKTNVTAASVSERALSHTVSSVNSKQTALSASIGAAMTKLGTP